MKCFSVGIGGPDLQFANVYLIVNQALRIEAALGNPGRGVAPAAVTLSLKGPGMCLRRRQGLAKTDTRKRNGGWWMSITAVDAEQTCLLETMFKSCLWWWWMWGQGGGG